MASTHDYPTKVIHIAQLTNEHVIVGSSGGLSAVLEVKPRYEGKVGVPKNIAGYTVHTEHGKMEVSKSLAVRIYCEKRPASEIFNDLETLFCGVASEEGAWKLIDELVDDIINSATLAMQEVGIPEVTIETAEQTVRDYYGNHYTS